MRLGFSHFFPQEKKLEYADYVKDISSNTILKLVSYINLKLALEKNDDKLQKFLFLKSFFSLGVKSYMHFENIFKTLEGTNIFNRVSNLKIIESEFSNFRGNPDTLEIPELTLNLLKAYLVVNDNLDKEQFSVHDDYKASGNIDAIEFSKIFFTPSHLTYSEFLMVENDFQYQIEMFSELVYFLERDEELSEYFKKFIQSKGLESSDEYLYRMLEIIMLYFKGGENTILNFLSTPENKIPKIFFAYSSNSFEFYKTNITNHKGRSDFSPIREKPLYECSKGELLILDLTFLINKLYRASSFEFLRFIANEEGRNKAFENAKSRISSNQLHKYFVELIASIFGSSKTIHLSENENLVDSYVRRKKNVFLFEFKDEIIPIKTKYETDYKLIIEGIKEKFVLSKQGKPKGVTQLSNAIENLNNEYKKFDNLDSKNIEESEIAIFPILVYTDSTLNFPGFNDTLEKEFFLQIKNIKDLKFRKIYGLIIINFRILIEYKTTFKKNPELLKELFMKYYSEIERKKNYSVFANPNNPDDFLGLLVSSYFFFKNELYKRGFQSEINLTEKINGLIKKFNS